MFNFFKPKKNKDSELYKQKLQSGKNMTYNIKNDFSKIYRD